MDAEYKDVNESAPIPSLTLEPELENTPKLVVAEETKLQQTKVAEPVLTPQEQQMVNDFAQKIDVENTAQILQYGAGTQKKMADFSDAALANVRTQDLGEVGDLIVNVRVADHERFKRNGDDLYLVSDISIAQAALGCEIEVEGIMPDEVVKVTVPAGAQYGDTVSVNNYGMPRIGGGGSRGRLIVQLRVVVPTNLSNKQRELLRAFADEMGDDVASGKKSVTDRIKSALDDILD